MKAGDVIALVDREEPNGFDAQTKLMWINDLDNRVFLSVVLTHEHEAGLTREPIDSIEDELLIPAPYATDCYITYLRAKIAAANLEAVRYNQHMTMFNSSYQEFVNYYNREHMPLSKRGNRFKF